MKRKATSSSGQQLLPDSFTRRKIPFDDFHDIDLTTKAEKIQNSRIISGTPGSDGSAFAALMTAVATKKPVITFILNERDGKLLPEIKLNSDGPNMLAPNASTSKTEMGDDIQSCRPATVGNVSSWGSECRLHDFSFLAQSRFPDTKSCEVELKIRTNISPKENKAEDHYNGFPIHHSLLKSMLQKAVRRRLTDSSIKLSLALAHVSTIELLRRLPIICLEDGYLHPSFPILVWCMIASSKGYLLPDYLLFVCVHIIAEVSESKYLDSSTGDEESTPKNRTNSEMAGNNSISAAASYDSMNTTPLSPTLQSSQVPDNHRTTKKSGKLIEYDVRQQPESVSRTLVISIMLRAAFGGMASDVIMLKRFYSSWFHRLFRSYGGESVGGRDRSPYLSPSLKCTSPTLQGNTAEDVTPFSSASPPTSSLCPPGGSNNRALSIESSPIGDAVYGLRMEIYMHSDYLRNLMKSESVWAQRFVLIFSSFPCQEITTPQDSSSALEVLSASISSGLVTGKGALSLYSSQLPNTTTVTTTTTASASVSVNLAPLLKHVHRKEDLTLKRSDLLSEGIDFHCDGEVVRAVRDRCGSRLISLMQSRVTLDTQDRKGLKNGSIQSHFLSANIRNSSNSDGINIGNNSNSNGGGACGCAWMSQESAMSDQIMISEEEINAVIKTVIWLFRSSVNTHRTWTSSIPNGDLGSSSGINQNNASSPMCVQYVTRNDAVKSEDNQVVNDCLPTAMSKEQTEYLEKKRKYAPYWGIICPSVKSYCEERKRDLEGKLQKYLHGGL